MLSTDLKPCEIQRQGNMVRVLFEGTREVAELDLSKPDDVTRYNLYLGKIR